MRIHLDDEDCPNARDRETAVRIVAEILQNDVFTRGTFAFEGYSVARRIARAMTAARADERRRGFDTPMPMRSIKPAKGAPAVLKRWPGLRPFHRVLVVDGIRFQNYQGAEDELISDDARIVVFGSAKSEIWRAEVDGEQLSRGGARLRFDTEGEAIVEAIRRMRRKNQSGWQVTCAREA